MLPVAIYAFPTSLPFRPAACDQSLRRFCRMAGETGDESEAPTPPIHYPTSMPYVDPITGLTSVDVGDLGLDMEDIGSIFNTPDMVHPAPGEEGGLNSQKYVRSDGTIDWDAMAADL